MSDTQANPEPEKMIAAVHAYVDSFVAGNLDGIVALFAPDATIEDPVGSEPVRGIDAIRDFYSKAVEYGTTLILDGTIRITREYAAFPFLVVADLEGKELRVEVIDTFRFNSANQIVEMRAYFGPVNMHGAA